MKYIKTYETINIPSSRPSDAWLNVYTDYRVGDIVKIWNEFYAGEIVYLCRSYGGRYTSHDVKGIMNYDGSLRNGDIKTIDEEYMRKLDPNELKGFKDLLSMHDDVKKYNL